MKDGFRVWALNNSVDAGAIYTSYHLFSTMILQTGTHFTAKKLGLGGNFLKYLR